MKKIFFLALLAVFVFITAVVAFSAVFIEELSDILYNGIPLSTDENNPTAVRKLAMLTVRGENVANKTIVLQYIVDGQWTRGGVVAEFDSNGEFNMVNPPFTADDAQGTVLSFSLAIMDTETEQIYSQTPTYYVEFAGEDSNLNNDVNAVVKSIVLSATELKITLRDDWWFDGGDFYLTGDDETIKCSTWGTDSNILAGGSMDSFLTYKMPYELEEKSVYQITLKRGLMHSKEGGDHYYNREFNTDLIVLGSGNLFPDVQPNNWAEEYIGDMYARCIVEGYPEGDFRPNGPVTRAEFAKMMYLTLQIDKTGDYSGVIVDQPFFEDVAVNDWSYLYVKYVGRYMTGFKAPDGTVYFYGGQAAVREDMAVALVKAMRLSNQLVDESELTAIFNDWEGISPNLRKYVLIAYKNELIDGYPGGIFDPQKTISRAETCALLMKVWNSKAMEKVVFD